MKKFFKVMLISICSLVAIVGCTQKEVDNSQKVENSDETIKVMEDVYVPRKTKFSRIWFVSV